MVQFQPIIRTHQQLTASNGFCFELQVTWNGSVSRNWANRITRYRETMAEDSPILINGALKILPDEINKVTQSAALRVNVVCSDCVIGFCILSNLIGLCILAIRLAWVF